MTGEGAWGWGGRVGGHWPVEEKAAGWEDDERVARPRPSACEDNWGDVREEYG